MDLSRITANELMEWGLLNLWKTSEEGGYAVRHGSKPVNDFGQPCQDVQGGETEPHKIPTEQPNFFEMAFPLLFPYGRGGIEADRSRLVDFRDHLKWALHYHDRQF